MQLDQADDGEGLNGAGADSTGGSIPFASALAECRAVLLRELRDGRTPAEARSAVIRLGEMARHDGVPPEAVLAEFKKVLVQLPPFGSDADREREETTQSLVTALIEAYYRRTDD